MYSRREFLQRAAATTLSLSLLGAQRRFDDAGWRILQRELSPTDGALLLPGSAAYEAHRHGFNLRLEAWPAAIFLARSEAGVQQACAWSRQTGRALVLRSGGHCYDTRNNADALLLDMGAIDGIDISANHQLVQVGAGVRQRPAQLFLAQQGLLLSGGTCATVGLTGLALGGDYCAWHDDAHTAVNIEAMRRLYAPLRPYFSGDAYVNYRDFDLEDWESAYYGSNYARLQAIKRRVDPDSFFSDQPQAIRVSG